MSLQRAGSLTCRLGMTRPIGVLSRMSTPSLLQSPSALSTSRRWVGGQKVSIQKGDEILNKQRFNRPVAPHLGVYELQQTWFGLSAWMRITGTTLSVASYAFFATYLLAPVIGLHLDTASLVSAFAGLPMMVKSGIKLAISFPFAFHFANGLKQLYSDMGFGFSKRAIKRTDYIIWSAGVLGAMYLTFGM